GTPTEPAAVHLTPPRSVMGPMSAEEHQAHLNASEMYKKYKDTLDPKSAYEMLTERVNAKMEEAETQKAEAEKAKAEAKEEAEPKQRKNEKSTIEKVVTSPVTQQFGKSLVRGLMGMLFGGGGGTRRKKKSSFF
ncbi:MAG: helicase HerA-like domain-containing protein, partial [Bacteroidia bacterium]